MLDFIKKLEETEDSKIARRISLNYRMLKGLQVGDYTLDIQASYYHYCTPRETLENLEDYENMEIAIFKDHKWVQPREDEVIKKFPRYEELVDLYEEGDTAVGGYLPVSLIQDLGDYLAKKEKV